MLPTGDLECWGQLPSPHPQSCGRLQHTALSSCAHRVTPTRAAEPPPIVHHVSLHVCFLLW